MAVHLTPALEQRLEHLANESHRSSDELAQEALESYLAHIEALIAEVRAGDESAEREGWLSNEEVFARIKERLLKTA